TPRCSRRGVGRVRPGDGRQRRRGQVGPGARGPARHHAGGDCSPPARERTPLRRIILEKAAMSEDLPILLLSGMGADERLFAPQRAAFPNLRVPAWIDPVPSESLRSYAARLGRRVDLGRPCLVGGASFGGIV